MPVPTGPVFFNEYWGLRVRSTAMAEALRAEITSNTDREIHITVTEDGQKKILFFHSVEGTWKKPPQTLDFAAVALSHYASAKGRDLYIDGPVSTEQLTNLDEFLQIW